MKFWTKFAFVITLIALISTIAILINEWRKDSAVWRSIKKAALEKELIRF